MKSKKWLNLVLAVLVLGGLITVFALTATESRGRHLTTQPMEEEPLDVSSLTSEASSEASPEASWSTESSVAYKSKVFDTSYVHTVDILLTDWEAFLTDAPEEIYYNASIVIDGERFDNVGIRSKGSSSLRDVVHADSERYSLKVEFDHYVDDQTYYGLDKLHLNNLYFDATCMKDYLAYYLMAEMEVPTSFCSYVYVTVNGEDLGLFIALEGIEDSFLERNFGEDFGTYLKPDDEYNQVVEETGTETAATAAAPTVTPSPTPTPSPVPTPTETLSAALGESDVADPVVTPIVTSQPTWLPEGQPELATLVYVGDDVDSYQVLFNSAKTDLSTKEKEQIIKSLKKLNNQKDLEEAIDIDEVINYMTVQGFLVNNDGYIGTRVHNYYLYVSKDGVMSMLPWDYNLSFGCYCFGIDMTTSMVVNCPLDNPYYGTKLGTRPMFDWIVQSYAYREQYYERTLYLVENYIENGKMEAEIDRIHSLIQPYLQTDPTKWITMEQFEAGVSELKQIIALRGESLKLQVQGVLPATIAGQAAAPETLVDVGDLDIYKTFVTIRKNKAISA